MGARSLLHTGSLTTRRAWSSLRRIIVLVKSSRVRADRAKSARPGPADPSRMTAFTGRGLAMTRLRQGGSPCSRAAWLCCSFRSCRSFP
jgi:hypothetical protein